MRDDDPRLPSSPGFWRSPLRGTWFTSVLGLVLLVGITVLFVTGLVSYAAYNPDLSPVNDQTPGKGILGFYLFSWPTDPHWLYRFTQGLHVTLGITLIPVLLAKLWSVVPRLFALPPARSLAHALERISLLLLVGGGLFEFTTGVLNVQLDYVFPGSFYPLHFYGAWVFFAAFVAHAVLKVPTALRAVRRRQDERDGREQGGRERDGREQGGRERDGREQGGRELGGRELGGRERDGRGQGGREQGGLVTPRPVAPTVSRRGALWFVGGASLLLLATTVGQSIGGALRRTALLAPHGGTDPGAGPNGFQINKTAAYAGIDPRETGAQAWRLVVTGRGGTVRLSRDQLLRMPLHSSALPIACVEGWSTADQWWRGVRLRDLAALVGHDGDPPDLFVESLQRHGAFRRAALRANQVADPRSLLALYVNGEDLSPDHGYPARIIVPAAPGVLNTKWVARLIFGDL
ncbi:molybdopterin-dependent oxidoreductase [Streptomyces sp. SP2-10]|uniref:molybdopterin-dependent oxidoreductase n=1 Tax=Streptomyces sp. SP2-10 TaxID=2873385 RepID=UPI001CA798C1|nr:molybdopterin-dependent oxidoreductase [Streptomyces sp. SP2-10]MBY8843920.1 molybdopterin-dependent oxidoreductase [Streptomyces sp. SP2-10]